MKKVALSKDSTLSQYESECNELKQKFKDHTAKIKSLQSELDRKSAMDTTKDTAQNTAQISLLQSRVAELETSVTQKDALISTLQKANSPDATDTDVQSMKMEITTLRDLLSAKSQTIEEQAAVISAKEMEVETLKSKSLSPSDTSIMQLNAKLNEYKAMLAQYQVYAPVVITNVLRTSSVFYGRDIEYDGAIYPSPYVLAVASFFDDMKQFAKNSKIFEDKSYDSEFDPSYEHSMRCAKVIEEFHHPLTLSQNWDNNLFQLRLMGAHLMACSADSSALGKLITARFKVVNSAMERQVLAGVQAKLKSEPVITEESVAAMGLSMYQIKSI